MVVGGGAKKKLQIHLESMARACASPTAAHSHLPSHHVHLHVTLNEIPKKYFHVLIASSSDGEAKEEQRRRRRGDRRLNIRTEEKRNERRENTTRWSRGRKIEARDHFVDCKMSDGSFGSTRAFKSQ